MLLFGIMLQSCMVAFSWSGEQTLRRKRGARGNLQCNARPLLPFFAEAMLRGKTTAMPERPNIRERLDSALLPLWTLLCAGALGCNSVPRVDPSGSQLLTTAPAATDPFAPSLSGAAQPAANAARTTASSCAQNLFNYSQEELRLTPREVIAPVGGQVVMKAEVIDRNGGKGAHRRVEWMLDSTSVGQLLADNSLNQHDWFFGLAGPREARKISQGYATSRTIKHCATITRGTATRIDDVDLVRGDAWVAVTSAVEGDSHVTAYAPDLHSWDRRQRNAVIHWVDVQWNAPPSSINSVGQTQPLTVTAARRSDGQPIQGWKVRYEVTGGPVAGFLPDGAPVREVETDANGQATVELYQSSQQQGVNDINIQLIRPAAVALGQSKPLTVGGVVVQHSWTSPDLGLIMSGPSQGSVGADLPFRMTVTNGGAAPTRNVVVSYPVPAGYQIVSSLPPAPVSQGRIQFPPFDLQPGQQQVVEVVVRGSQAGSTQHCADVESGEGLRARNCVTTNLGQPTLEVRTDLVSQSAAPVMVGDPVTFLITLTNRGTTAVNNITVTDTPGPGLLHPATTPDMPRIKRTLPNPLLPGASEQIAIEFTTAQEGRLTHTVEVVGDEAQASAVGAVDVVARAGGAPAGSLVVEKIGPFRQVANGQYEPTTTARVGENVLFRTKITNRGQFALRNVVVEDRYDTQLYLEQATIKQGDSPREIDEAINAVIWRFGTLLGGEERIYEVLTRIDGPGRELCGEVTVTADGGASAKDRLCLSTENSGPLPPAGSATPGQGAGGLPLRPTMVIRPSTARAGDQVTISLNVQNTSRFSDRGISMAVQLPPGVQFVRAASPGLGSRFDAATSRVIFQPITELLTGDNRPFEVVATVSVAGQPQFTAAVSSSNQPTPVSVQETLQVFP